MTKDLKALIEDLRLNHEYCPKEIILQAADELERLAQPEQGEPVAWEQFHEHMGGPFYVAPQRTWVGLTDEDIENAYIRTEHFVDMAKVLDDILKEKNT
jgi:hypothetical protein